MKLAKAPTVKATPQPPAPLKRADTHKNVQRPEDTKPQDRTPAPVPVVAPPDPFAALNISTDPRPESPGMRSESPGNQLLVKRKPNQVEGRDAPQMSKTRRKLAWGFILFVICGCMAYAFTRGAAAPENVVKHIGAVIGLSIFVFEPFVVLCIWYPLFIFFSSFFFVHSFLFFFSCRLYSGGEAVSWPV
jgi:hypothetical protein